MIQYLQDTSTTEIIVLTDDIPANHGIKVAVDELGYRDAIGVYSLSDIINVDVDDSLNMI